MKAWSLDAKKMVIVRIDKGEDLLEQMQDALAKQRITDGAIVAGFGSVAKYKIHMVDTPTYPPIDYAESKSGAFQIQSLQGIIADSEIHAHILLSNKHGAFGGHLEKGCEAFTGAEVAIVAFEPGILKRIPDEEYPESAIRNLSD